MTILNERKSRFHWSATAMVAACLACPGLAPAATEVKAGEGEHPAHAAAAASLHEAAHFSPAVREVVKLVEAQVTPEVIRGYIENCPYGFHLSANEIVALKESGMTSEVLVTMLQHRGPAREQPAAPAPVRVESPAPVVAMEAPVAPAQPAVTYVYDNPALSYPYGYPSYSYGWYNNVGYPYVWLYGGGYPYRSWNGYSHYYHRGGYPVHGFVRSSGSGYSFGGHGAVGHSGGHGSGRR